MSELLLILFLLFLLAAGVPVFVALSITSIVALLAMEGPAGIEHIADIIFARLDTYAFVAIPLFAYMAQILIRTNALQDVYNTVNRIAGNIKNSAGATTLGVATVFSAVSGSSVATAVTLSDVSIPQMLKHGYSKRSAYGLVAASGTLGILIPPSIALIVYGIIADVSISGLFIAALLPALLLISLFCLYDRLQLSLQPSAGEPADEQQTSPDQSEPGNGDTSGSTGKFKVSMVALLPVLIIGGLYSGVFTPSEAGAVGVVLSMLLATCVYRQLTLKGCHLAAKKAAENAGLVFAIVAGAALFGHVIVITEIPLQLLEWVISMELDALVFLLGLMALIFIMGMFLEGASITLVTTPLILPALDLLGIDRMWYGILLVINLEMSLISPPVGLNLMVIKGAARAQFSDVVYGALPYVLLMMLAIALIALFPGIALYLPGKIA